MSREGQTQDEKALEKRLCSRINSGTDAVRGIEIATHSGTCTLLDLLGEHIPEPIEDNSGWNQHKTLSIDLFGGITPDIVLRSRLSSENRIIIEVKKTSAFTHKERHASQVLRYFLHILATTSRYPGGKKDIRRAVLLAAPKQWFDSKCSVPWNFFLQDYGPLADQFDVTIGKIVLD